jgi:NAD-dependent dihydropyrimidine dehydrogenase PreA subunit
MTYIITSLCLRDAGCVEVCPVECILPGKPQTKWPWFYIDPDTCIDCGACVPECPWEAIFPEDEVPTAYEARGGEFVSMPAGTPGFDTAWDGTDHHGEAVHLDHVRELEAGEVLDLTKDDPPNYHYFGVSHPSDTGDVEFGPGYDALDMD